MILFFYNSFILQTRLNYGILFYVQITQVGLEGVVRTLIRKYRSEETLVVGYQINTFYLSRKLVDPVELDLPVQQVHPRT